MVASTRLGSTPAFLFDARLPAILSQPDGSLANSFPADSFLSTGGGDITVLIPSNISVMLKATSTAGAGTIVSDFPIRISTRGALTAAEGRIHGGGPVLQIVGSGGTISIKRQ